MAPERELETYRAELPNLLTQEGKFADLQGDRVAGLWETYEDALKAGYQEFGGDEFMVQQIRAVEPVHCVTRGTPICRS